MGTYEDGKLVVKASPIEGLGLFAKRAFRKEETVLRWHPRRISEEEFRDTPAKERRYLGTLEDGTKVLMPRITNPVSVLPELVPFFEDIFKF